ncbi:DNA polymerase-3 subunit epsilon [Chitinivorax tropicus]|uniref:DNA polymerase III subunit epsilon n=1 Tax=Chitinivorax tropicus TaxID=714531 RepID=A0A840MKE2_9PROT|nr:DNA polymerase III subunit epsilon [Chitinivorax tropicus]MBB5019654.1 DNA polymerase-3 subunit epsilon [Chitinivorax tropicus]
MRQIILDTETTGLEPSQGHRIIEIAAVEMINRVISPADRHLHLYINPERDSDEAALNVHGLTTAFLSDKPKFAEIAREFLDFVKGAELIIHNAPFDLGFINHEFAMLGMGRIQDQVAGVIDTLAMAKEMRPGKRNNLDALCDFFGVDRSARVLHGALIDCELLGDVYLSMTRGQESLMMDMGEASPAATIQFQAGKRGPLKVIAATDDESAAHEGYLKDLDKAVKGSCIWRQLTTPSEPVDAGG